MSAEDQAKLLSFLAELEELRKNNPTKYDQAIKELGLTEILSTHQETETSPPSLQTLTEQIKNSKGLENLNMDDSSNAVNLPGGQSILGSKGVEEKVNNNLILSMYLNFPLDEG